MEVRRQSRPLGLGRGHGKVALELGPLCKPDQRVERELAPDDDSRQPGDQDDQADGGHDRRRRRAGRQCHHQRLEALADGTCLAAVLGERDRDARDQRREGHQHHRQRRAGRHCHKGERHRHQ